jgi:uncharacterized protein (DUF4415 family)
MTEPQFDTDNPKWTAADFAKAKRGEDIPAHIRPAIPNTRGRPKGSDKQMVNLRLDKDIVERFRASGPGWQSRFNEALRKGAGAAN